MSGASDRQLMDKTRTDRFRALLHSLRAELDSMVDLSKEATQTVELDQARVGRLSRMDALQGQQMAQEANRRRELKIAKIDGALRRIDSGTFGVCTSCGEEIDHRRLKADPSATKCVPCADR
ncbi:MAG: TraR/DksA C4-type zinc finger protein [Steroidobacteraceae bacterium]